MICEMCNKPSQEMILARCKEGHLHSLCPDCEVKARIRDLNRRTPGPVWPAALAVRFALFALALLALWVVLSVLGVW